MKNLNLNLNKTRIATIILTFLLISSTFAIFANAQIDTSTVNIATNANSEKINPETGQPYGDLSQYEWIAAGADGANTRSSKGPAPDTPSLLWSISRSASGTPSAFNGLVFVRSSSTVYAYNATTGDYAKGWPVSSTGTPTGSVGSGSAPGFGSNGAVVKINEQIGGWFTSVGPQFFNISNGYSYPKGTLGGDGWTSMGAGFSAMYYGMMYSPEDQCFISVARSTTTGAGLGICIDATDPTGKGAFTRWQVEFDTAPEAMGFGGGNAYFGGYGEGLLYAVNMQTGKLVWTAYKPGNVGYSTTYYDGVVYHSASSTQITGFDAATGTVVSTFDILGARAFYVYGMSAMYGRIFAHSIEIPQGWIGAFTAKTLAQQWKYPAEYYIAYLVGAVADRKFIITTSDVAAGSAVPGYPDVISTGRKLTAVDAFTGKLVWSFSVSSAPLAPTIAYGNLYTQEGSTLKCYSDLASTQKTAEQAGWPRFHGPFDADGASTGTAVGNYPTNIKQATWKFQANQGISGSPVAVAGKVFFGSWGGYLYCLDAIKGTEIWSKHYDTRILSTPTYDNGILYTGTDDGNAYALNASTGAQIWKAFAGGRTEQAVQLSAWQPKSSPIVWNSTHYICGSNDGILYCFNATDGTALWTHQASNYADGIGGSVTVHKDLNNITAVYLMANARLWKIDINGTTLINTALGTNRGTSSTPTIINTPQFGDLLFVTYGSGGTGSTLAIRNATTMAAISTGILSFASGSTYMTQSPTYVASQSCIIKGTANVPLNETNLGPSSPSSGTTAQNTYRMNNTNYWYIDAKGENVTVWNYMTRTLPAVYVAESTDASCWAIIYNGTNLGTGTTQATQWIVNSTTHMYMVRVWDSWAGHQVYSSASVAILNDNPNCPINYIGNAAYGFTAYNGTTGDVVSTFSADGQVFSTAALYQDKVFMTGNDGYCYAFFGTTEGETTVYGNSNKGDTMLLNEPTLIEGGLYTGSYFESPYDSNNNQTFTDVRVPYATVHLVWVNPDSTSEELLTTTDIEGNFNFTYTPTVAGTAQWLLYFDGSIASTGSVLGQAYSDYKTMNVMGEQTPTPETPTPTPTTGPILPIEYVYVIVGIIVALVIVLAAVMLLRKRKHPKA